MSRWVPGLALLLSAAACVFAPDLSRFPTCEAGGVCPGGSSCLEPEGICLPDCGARGPCLPDVPGPADAGGTGTPDAGVEPLVLEEEALGDGVVAVEYPFQFRARGGTPPYTFSSRGELPPGLRLDAARGTLSGKPTTAGDFTFTLELGDPGARSAERAFTVRIRSPLSLTGPGILADFPKGGSYKEQLSAVGGQPPYRFELVPGNALPSGLVLGATGEVQGSTSAAGTAAFEVRVTDDARPPQTVTRSLQLTASKCSLAPCIRTRSVPEGRVGERYDYSLQATTNTGSPTWKVTFGALPPGLELTSSTGRISGTPTTEGPYGFTVSVEDVLTSAESESLRLEIKF